LPLTIRTTTFTSGAVDSLTTVLGLLPLAYGVGAGADMVRPMAIAVIGSLCMSLVISLTVSVQVVRAKKSQRFVLFYTLWEWSSRLKLASGWLNSTLARHSSQFNEPACKVSVCR
jgi:hypothetical protein